MGSGDTRRTGMRFNTAKKLLRDGKPAVGLWINMPSVVGV